MVLSGGHTSLLLIHDIENYQVIGNTIDDAIGEAFDKVARLMNLRYPGGPEIENLAIKGDPTKFPFKPCKVKNQKYNFSFSGLKTQVLYTLKGQNGHPSTPTIIAESDKKHIAASFQKTAFNDLLAKCALAIKEYDVKHLYIGGGVSNNQYIRSLFKENLSDNIDIFWPNPGLSLDNAAMIAGLGYHTFAMKKNSDPLDLVPSPTNKSLSI